MDEAAQELAQVNNNLEALPPQPKEGLFSRFRRAFSKKPTTTAPVTNEPTLEQQIAQNEARQAQLTTEAKNIVDRSLGDMTLADRRMAASNQEELANEQRIGAELRARAETVKAPQAAAETPTVASPEAPTEQPSEKPVVVEEPAAA